MTHSEAAGQQTAERYLLDELGPDEREAFEEHVFDCPECAFDLRAGAAFIREAKVQLPQFAPAVTTAAVRLRQPQNKSPWFSWFTPAFAVPAFAALLLLIGYQNLATIPGLRRAAAQPRVVPWTSVHMDTRAAGPAPVVADRSQGVMLFVDVPQQGAFTSFSFELYDSQGQRVWKSPAVAPSQSANGTLSLLIPGPALREGAYTLAISGILPSGQTTEVSRKNLHISFAG